MYNTTMTQNINTSNTKIIENDLNFDNLELRPDEVDYVIYHGNCSDGYASAYSAYEYLSKKYPDRNVTYHSASFNKLPPLNEITKKNILICDFSYKMPDLMKILKICNKLAILDHHKSAESYLKDLDDKYKVFRMDHSGAYLTWCYFNTCSPNMVPKMIKYIEDNDLWLKNLENTLEFTAFMFTLPFTFEEYGKLMDDNYIKDTVFIEGKGMVKQNTSIISNTIKQACPKFIKINKKYYFIGSLNSTILKSEIGNKICDVLKYVNFSAIYSINDYNNSTTFSLRSVKTATDVSLIAEVFGGAGHRNASGMSLNYVTNEFPGKIDNHKTYFLLENISKNKIKNYDTIELNVSHFQKELGKYLLQDRYTTDDKITYQEGQFIFNKINNTNNIDRFILSVMWNYDGKNNKTWHTITIDENSSGDFINEITEYLNIYDDYNYNIDSLQFTITLKGLNVIR
jgi:nanoRNase/pAp phosphatase (c-di-AMP/oligoRNAs hydrolase)